MISWRGMAALVVLVTGLTLVACGDTTEIVDCYSCTCNPRYCAPTFQDLSLKWHVLNNFELAHNKRNMTEYDRLIDDNYTFSFDTIQNGSQVTIAWGRPDDITATAGLLSAAAMVDVDINQEKLTWTSMTASNNSGETWYTTTTYYNFTIKIGSTTYTPVSEAQMSFTVRNAGTTAKPKWKLVELRDDAHLIAPPPAVAAALHTEQSTYGKVKSGL